MVRLPATGRVQVGCLPQSIPQRRLCGGLTLLVRQLITKTIIDALASAPGEPIQVSALLVGWSSATVTTDHKAVFGDRRRPPDLSSRSCGGSSGEAVGGHASRSRRRYHRCCEPHLLTIGKPNHNTCFALGIARPPCCGPISRVPRGIPCRARRCTTGRYSHTCTPRAPESGADDLTKAPMIRFHRGERR